MEATASTSNHSYKWEVLAVVMIGTLMAALDQSIVNICLPDIMADFGSPVDDIEWVITGYMLAFATLMPLTAWLRERIGYKRLYVISLFVFTIGSILCALAPNLPTLVAARVIQALGGGAITPIALAMISDVFEPQERGKAIGYWGVGVIVGPAFGPTLGGYLTNYFGWRSIFTVNLPIGIIGVLLALALLREDKPSEQTQKHPFDLWGFIFLSAFLVSFLLALSQGEEKGWSSPFIYTCWIIAFTGFIGFLVVEAYTPHGIMDIRLLKSPVYAACMMVVSARSLALFGGIFLLPLFLQQVMGFDEIKSGLIQLPGSLLIALSMPIAGKVNDRFGPLWPTLGGLAGVAYFMCAYRTLDINTSIADVINPTYIRGIAIGFLVTPVMVTALNSVPKDKTSMASSMMNLIQQVSGSIGIGILGAILNHRTVFHQGQAASVWDPSSPASQQALSNMGERLHTLGLSHGDAAQGAHVTVAGYILKLASVSAFEDAFFIGGIVVLASMLPALLLPAHNANRAAKTETVAVME